MMIDWGAMLAGGPPSAEAAEAAMMPAAEEPAAAPSSLLPSIHSVERRWDNRRRCAECANLATAGRCLAAARHELVASRSYAPAPDWLRRCEAFRPLPDDPDQRPGRDRWPGLA